MMKKLQFSIFRHAKTVHDQTAREKILQQESKIPVAAVSANLSTLDTARSLQCTIK